MIRTIPITNVGIAIPTAANAGEHRRRGPVRPDRARDGGRAPRSAAPNTIAMNASMQRRRRSAARSASVTENWLKYDEPKSPCRMPPTQSTYCSGIDLSRPSSPGSLRASPVDLLDRAAELRDRRVARDHPHQQEDGDRAQDQQREARDEPPEDVPEHRVFGPLLGRDRGRPADRPPQPCSTASPRPSLPRDGRCPARPPTRS